MRAFTKAVLLTWATAVSLLLTSCSSGTWVDDAGNFKRVFDFSQPDDVKVLRSYYWKSPHWTLEYNYFIALSLRRNSRRD